MNFRDFNFEPQLMEGLDAMGFETPTPIQEQAIPYIIDNKDLIACAQTGTGKTAAYLLPIINKIIQTKDEHFNTLIVVPTRELAIQIDEALQGFAYFAPVSSIAIYGGNDGSSFDQEKKALSHGASIIIATPGRLISHLGMGYVKADKIQHLVLDEADRMLDMGFNEDINRIITYLPAKRQTLMFSATMPPRIRTLAQQTLHKPAHINIAVSKPAEGVMQGAYIVHNEQKPALIRELLTGKQISSILIFCSKKDRVKLLERDLRKSKFNVDAIHSDLEQEKRIEVLRQFKNKNLQILVATDVLSRGIDIDSIGLVINYDVPNDAEDYIHRVGRTARAATTGVALTLVNPEDQYKLKKIEELIGEPIRKLAVPSHMGEAPEYNPSKKYGKPGGKRHFGKRKKQ